MHAVFDVVRGASEGSSTTGVGVAPIGFLNMETGVEDMAVFFFVKLAIPFFLLLILVLPFVDMGSQDYLSGTRLCLKLRELKVAGPRRPGQDVTDPFEILLS